MIPMKIQMRLVGQRSIVDAQRHHQGDEAERDAVDLRLDDAAPPARGAVDLREANGAEGQHRD